MQCVAFMVEKCANMNDRNVVLPNHTQKESVFFSVTKPDIPTKDYVKRLVTYTQCSPEAFVVMLVYVDRIATENTRLVITSYNMHRILVTALTLACKTLDDKCFSNVHYAKVGGIPTAKEMNRLELQFLKYIKYDLFVHEDTFFEKQRSLEYLPSPSSPVSVTYYSEDVDFDNSPACDSKELCATFQSFSSHPRTSYTQSSIGSSVSHESVPVMAAPVMGNGHGNPRGVTMTVDSRMYTNPKSRSQAYQTHPSAYAMHETRAAQDKRFRRSPEPPGSGRTSRGSPHSRERRNRKESRLNQYRGGNANGQHQFVADFLG